MWVLTLEGEADILRVDAASNRVTARIDIPVPGSVGPPAAGGGFLWVPVVQAGHSWVVRLDGRTGDMVGDAISAKFPGSPIGVARGGVWFFGDRPGGQVLSRLNIETLEFDASLNLDEAAAAPSIRLAAVLASHGRTIWVANHRDSVTRIDLFPRDEEDEELAQPAEDLQPYEDPWGDLEPGLNELPPPPSARVGQAVVWTGRELVAWGGAIQDGEVLFDDGFVFDARSRSWALLSDSPLSARGFPAAVWTGREVVIWGGWDGREGFFADGAAYDPARGVWRPLPPSPLDPRSPRGAVWTGKEMIVWGSGNSMPDRRDVTGAAYDPATDTWRRIADAPHPVNWGSVVWSGEEMIVVGASVHHLNRSDTPNAVAAAYDPASDRWRELPKTDLDPNGTFAIWTGDFLLALDYNHRVRAYDADADEWRSLPSIPLDDGEDWPQFAAVGDRVLVETISGYAVLDIASSTWSEAQIPASRPGTPIPAGDAIVIWERDPPGEPPDSLLVWKPA